MNLSDLGWSPFFQDHFEALPDRGDASAARVTREHRGMYELATDRGFAQAEIVGRLRHSAASRAALPAVGDWVAARLDTGGRALISHVLPRRSQFSRNAAGIVTEEQVVAANVDTVFLVSGLDRDFNPRRIERYLTLAWESGATPVIVLNKADLRPDEDELNACIEEASAIAFGVPVHAVSAMNDEGITALQSYLGPGRTLALIGSSGVGKSSLVNRLCGATRMFVNQTSDTTGKGQHTTTHRELVVLPIGGALIDTPGMREIQLWADEECLDRAFAEIAELASDCHFRDCKHVSEPHCAVQGAIGDGALDEQRLASYRKQQRELARLAQKEALRVARVLKVKM